MKVIQNENWQYFIETILTACKANNGGINDTVDLKNTNLIKNSIESITIFKQTYLNFDNQISQYLRKHNKNLPADERNEIDCDLQRNNYFINLGKTNEFSDHNIIDTFGEFFQQHRRFPGSQDLIVVSRPEIPYFIKTDKIISTNQLFEKFSSSDVRGLVSIQALATLNIYLGGNAEISRQALTEFLHNMSHQALNKDNDNVFIQFDRTAELIIELISVLLDRKNKSLNIANIINNNVSNIYALQMSKDELDAANESADQKNKKIIRDIIDPTPGRFIDDKLNPNEQNLQNTTTFLIFQLRYNSSLMKLSLKK